MLSQNDLEKIKEIITSFFKLTTVNCSQINVFCDKETNNSGENIAVINVNVILDDPQILIGEKGQTLFETQRILRMILNKKINSALYLNLDINSYKAKKEEYLKDIAKDLADDVSITKKEKILMPMSPYERKIVHAQLSQRSDVITESQGYGSERHIIIKPK